MKEIVYHCEADVELVAAAKRYKCRSEGLGSRFLRAVHDALAHIQEDPKRYPIFDRPARACRVRSFPYRVIYEEWDGAIYILAIAHDSRDSGYWRNRLS